MPSLVAFRRRWMIGSDDLVFPGLLETFVRIAWLMTIIIVVGMHYHRLLYCSGGSLLAVYLIGVIIIIPLQILLALCVAYTSAQGNIVVATPRKRIPLLIYIRTIVFIIELGWCIFGIVWSYHSSVGCESHVINVIRAAAIASVAIMLILAVGMAVVFDPLGAESLSVTGSRSRQNSSDSDSGFVHLYLQPEAEKIWETRCRLLCCVCFINEKSKAAFTDIARLIAGYFEGIDLVPSDIAAGLVLLQMQQQQEDRRQRFISAKKQLHMHEQDREQAEHAPEQVLVSTWMTLPMILHYLKFALSVYGWPLYALMHPLTGCFNLYRKAKCCSCWRQDFAVDDNCLSCNSAAVLNVTGLHSDQVIFSSFRNQVYEVPFLVVVDDETESVVISIRGTLSIGDALTDLTAEACCVNVAHDVPEHCIACKAHKGIFQTAEYVKATLEREQILEKAFSGREGYNLVLTGHSLGAGSCALLAVLLKPSYPNLMCFAYSPPGGLLNLEKALETQHYICSVVLGKDLVPRLGIASMEDFKLKLLRALYNCDKPKYRILMSGAWCALFGVSAFDTQTDSEPTTASPSPNNEHSLLCDRTNALLGSTVEEALAEAALISSRSRLTHERLYPPGRILHIVETTFPSNSQYKAVWAETQDFQDIQVNATMLLDHLPSAVYGALQQLVDRKAQIVSGADMLAMEL